MPIYTISSIDEDDMSENPFDYTYEPLVRWLSQQFKEIGAKNKTWIVKTQAELVELENVRFLGFYSTFLLVSDRLYSMPGYAPAGFNEKCSVKRNGCP